MKKSKRRRQEKHLKSLSTVEDARVQAQLSAFNKGKKNEPRATKAKPLTWPPVRLILKALKRWASRVFSRKPKGEK